MPKVGIEPARKADIINAALECLCEEGIDNLTLDKVAAKAGCSKGIVPYYFKTKDGLIIEALKAFLSYYQKKIGSNIKRDMQPEAMLETVLQYALPFKDEDSCGLDRHINVSDLDGIDRMYIPTEKITKLFIQFFSKAVINRDFQAAIREVYGHDIGGIKTIIDYGIYTEYFCATESQVIAHTLMALIIGFSFFRVIELAPPGRGDDRELCWEYLRRLLREKPAAGK